MSTPLFDSRRRDVNRQRARTMDGDYFLHARALDDIAERLDALDARAGNTLLVGPLDAPLPATTITRADCLEDIEAVPRSLDLIILLGELDVADDPAAVMLALRHLLRPGGMLAGCVVGGDSLPRLRAAMLEADRSIGRAAQRIHPMLDGSSLSTLLQSAGFEHPVIEIDRVNVSYRSLDGLVADLRAMGCSSALRARAPALTRSQLALVRDAFMEGEERAFERFELIHFTATAGEESR